MNDNLLKFCTNAYSVWMYLYCESVSSDKMSTKCKEKLQNDFCKSHTSRTEKELNRICPSKLTKRELEDLYFVLLDNNIVLKKTVNTQDDKIRCLSTKVLRLTAIHKNSLSKEQNSCCISTKAAIEEQNNTLAELRKANDQMTEKISLLNTRICSAKQFLRKSLAHPISKKFSAIDRSSKATSNSSLATIKETEQNINKTNIATSTTALNVGESDRKLTKMVSCECRITGKSPSDEKSALGETRNEPPERLCNANKCRTEIEELKLQIASLQEELNGTRSEYVSRISELEMSVLGHRGGSAAAQAQRATSEERLRRTRAELAESKALSDELATQLSVEKRRVDELGTQLKSARLSGDVARSLAQQISHNRLLPPKDDDVTSTYTDISRSPAKPTLLGADKQRASTSQPARAAPDEARPSDDSGYTDADDKNLELIEKIATLQEQLDEIRRLAPAQAPYDQKSQVKPRTSEFESSVQSINEADVPVIRNVRDYKCVIVDPAKKTISQIEHVNRDGGDAAGHTTEVTATEPTLSMPAVRTVPFQSAPGLRSDEAPVAATTGTEPGTTFRFVEGILSDENTTPVPTKPHPDLQKRTDLQDDLDEMVPRGESLAYRRPTPFIPRPRTGLLSQQIPGPIPTEKTRRVTKPRRITSVQPRATIEEHTTEYRSEYKDANIKSPKCQPCPQTYQDNGNNGTEEGTSTDSEPRVVTQAEAEHETCIGVTEIGPIELNRLDVCEKYARVCTCPKLVPKDLSMFRTCSGTLRFTTSSPSENTFRRCRCSVADDGLLENEKCTQHDSPVCRTQGPETSKFPCRVSRAQETTMPNLKDGTCSPVEDMQASTFQDTGTSATQETRVSGSQAEPPRSDDPNLKIFQPARTAVLPRRATSEVDNEPDLYDYPEPRSSKKKSLFTPLPGTENPTVSGLHEPRTSIRNPKTLRLQEPRASIRDHETQQFQERRSYQDPEFLQSQDRKPSMHASAIHRLEDPSSSYQRPEILNSQASSKQNLSGSILKIETDPPELQPIRSALLGRKRLQAQSQPMPYQEPASPSPPVTYSVSGSAEVELRAHTSTEPDHTDYDISEIADSPRSFLKSRSTSPGEQKLTSTYTESYSPTGEYACLSEGEVPTKADRRLSAGEKLVNFVKSNAREPLPVSQLTTAEQMEATLHAISEELRRCKLLLQSKAGEKYSMSPSCEVALKKCSASAEIVPRPRNKCIFTLHVSTVVLSDEAMALSRDLSLMLTWQFYQQHAAMTRLDTGRVLHLDYSTEYELPMTNSLLNYLKHEKLPILICEMDKPERPLARCALPLRDALLHVNRRADMSLALLRGGGQLGGAEGGGSHDEMGVIDLWCMLRVEMDQPTFNVETPTGSNKTTDLRLMEHMFPRMDAASLSSDLDRRVDQRRAPNYEKTEEYRMYNLPTASTHDYHDYVSRNVAKVPTRGQFGNPQFGSTDSNLEDSALVGSDSSLKSRIITHEVTTPRKVNNMRQVMQKEREQHESEENFSQLPSHMRLSSASAKTVAARQQFFKDAGTRVASYDSMYEMDEQWKKPTKVTPEHDTTRTSAELRKTSRRDIKFGRDDAKKSVTIGPYYDKPTKDYYEGFPEEAACPRFHITIQWLALNEEWSGAQRSAAQLYVAYSFLGRGGAQLESATKLAKPQSKCHFNDTKTFLLTDADLPALGHLAKCRSIPGAEHNSSDCITFSVVSEPPPDPLGLGNCEDIGYAYLYLGDLVAYSTGDMYTEVLPVRAPPPGDAVCGVLSVRVDGLSVARRCAMLSNNDEGTA